MRGDKEERQGVVCPAFLDTETPNLELFACGLLWLRVAYLAVFHAVREIDDHANCKPHDQPNPSETTMPRIGTSGTSGVLNGRGRSGRRLRNMITAPQTITNASSVPMLTIWPRLPIGTSEPKMAAPNPVTAVDFHGVRNFG